MAIGLIFLLIASVTGGLAGALVRRSREDRPILVNGAIGTGGWAFAWIVIRLFSGEWPAELSLVGFALALAGSVVIVRIVERLAVTGRGREAAAAGLGP